MLGQASPLFQTGSGPHENGDGAVSNQHDGSVFICGEQKKGRAPSPPAFILSWALVGPPLQVSNATRAGPPSVASTATLHLPRQPSSHTTGYTSAPAPHLCHQPSSPMLPIHHRLSFSAGSLTPTHAHHLIHNPPLLSPSTLQPPCHATTQLHRLR